MKRIILLITIVISVHMKAQDSAKYTHGGFAIQFGTGLRYGGTGVAFEVQNLTKGNWRFSPYFGLGVQKGGVEKSVADYYWMGLGTGFDWEYGRKHRIVFGPEFIVNIDIFNKPEDAVIYQKTIMAPSANLGYKFTGYKGFIFQLMGGVAYIKDPYVIDSGFSFHPHASVGIGFKI